MYSTLKPLELSDLSSFIESHWSLTSPCHDRSSSECISSLVKLLKNNSIQVTNRNALRNTAYFNSFGTPDTLSDLPTSLAFYSSDLYRERKRRLESFDKPADCNAKRFKKEKQVKPKLYEPYEKTSMRVDEIIEIDDELHSNTSHIYKQQFLPEIKSYDLLYSNCDLNVFSDEVVVEDNIHVEPDDSITPLLKIHNKKISNDLTDEDIAKDDIDSEPDMLDIMSREMLTSGLECPATPDCDKKNSDSEECCEASLGTLDLTSRDRTICTIEDIDKIDSIIYSLLPQPMIELTKPKENTNKCLNEIGSSAISEPVMCFPENTCNVAEYESFGKPREGMYSTERSGAYSVGLSELDFLNQPVDLSVKKHKTKDSANSSSKKLSHSSFSSQTVSLIDKCFEETHAVTMSETMHYPQSVLQPILEDSITLKNVESLRNSDYSEKQVILEPRENPSLPRGIPVVAASSSEMVCEREHSRIPVQPIEILSETNTLDSLQKSTSPGVVESNQDIVDQSPEIASKTKVVENLQQFSSPDVAENVNDITDLPGEIVSKSKGISEISGLESVQQFTTPGNENISILDITDQLCEISSKSDVSGNLMQCSNSDTNEVKYDDSDRPSEIVSESNVLEGIQQSRPEIQESSNHCITDQHSVSKSNVLQTIQLSHSEICEDDHCITDQCSQIVSKSNSFQLVQQTLNFNNYKDRQSNIDEPNSETTVFDNFHPPVNTGISECNPDVTDQPSDIVLESNALENLQQSTGCVIVEDERNVTNQHCETVLENPHQSISPADCHNISKQPYETAVLESSHQIIENNGDACLVENTCTSGISQPSTDKCGVVFEDGHSECHEETIFSEELGNQCLLTAASSYQEPGILEEMSTGDIVQSSDVASIDFSNENELPGESFAHTKVGHIDPSIILGSLPVYVEAASSENMPVIHSVYSHSGEVYHITGTSDHPLSDSMEGASLSYISEEIVMDVPEPALYITTQSECYEIMESGISSEHEILLSSSNDMYVDGGTISSETSSLKPQDPSNTDPFSGMLQLEPVQAATGQVLHPEKIVVSLPLAGLDLNAFRGAAVSISECQVKVVGLTSPSPNTNGSDRPTNEIAISQEITDPIENYDSSNMVTPTENSKVDEMTCSLASYSRTNKRLQSDSCTNYGSVVDTDVSELDILVSNNTNDFPSTSLSKPVFDSIAEKRCREIRKRLDISLPKETKRSRRKSETKRDEMFTFDGILRDLQQGQKNKERKSQVMVEETDNDKPECLGSTSEVLSILMEVADKVKIPDTSARKTFEIPIFDADAGFQYSSHATAELLWSSAIQNPSTRFEKKLSSLTYSEFLIYFESQSSLIVLGTLLSGKNEKNFLMFLWKLMSIHSSKSVVVKCQRTIILWAVERKLMFWPAFCEILKIFINLGVSGEQCPFPKSYAKERRVLESQRKMLSYKCQQKLKNCTLANKKEVLLHNLGVVIATLARVIRVIYGDDLQEDKPGIGDQLSQLFYLLSWLACDEQIITSVARTNICECLDNIISNIPAQNWPTQLPVLTNRLVALGVCHERILHLVSLFHHTYRGNQLAKCICFSSLQYFLKKSCDIFRETVSVKDVLCTLKSEKLHKIEDHNVLYSLLKLVETCVDLSSAQSEEEWMKRIIDYLTNLSSKVRDSMCTANQPMVKNLLVSMTSKWKLLPMCHSRKNFLFQPPQPALE